MGFYQLSYSEKKTYCTQRLAKKVAFALDTKEQINRHNSKAYEYEHLKDFFGREQLITYKCSYEDFCSYIKRHPVIFIKLDGECCGTGIKKITVDESNQKVVYEKVHAINAVIDEPVMQHLKLEKLCPGSVNTVRIITAKVEGTVYIIGAALRMGNGRSDVDNFGQGGIAGALDKKTGIIIERGIDHSNRRYDEHPYSHVRIKGFQVPNWDKVLHLINKCAKVYDLNYVGWDVAIRQDDCVIIEANPRPMIEVIQLAGNGGKKAEYKRIYGIWKKSQKL